MSVFCSTTTKLSALIPESKIVMMNHDYYIVRDTVEEIIEKIAKYNAKVQDIHREIAVVERYKE